MLVIVLTVFFVLGFMTAELMESEKTYKRKEYDRRRDLKRDFERKMFNLEMYGDINGGDRYGCRENF